MTKYFSSKLRNISIKRIISYIRSEIKIPIIIFSGYEYYNLKYMTRINKHTANAIIDKMVDISKITINLIFIIKILVYYFIN